MKLKTNPTIYETDQNGNKLVSKFDGKPQCRVLATFEGEEKQRMGFIGNVELAKSWKAGDDIDVVFSEKEYNGKMYYNFKLAGKNDKVMVELDKVKKFIKELVVLNKLKIPKQ